MNTTEGRPHPNRRDIGTEGEEQDENRPISGPIQVGPPNILDIRFAWEGKYGSKQNLLDEHPSTASIVSKPATPWRSFQANSDLKPNDNRPGSAPGNLYPRDSSAYRHLDKARRRIFSGSSVSLVQNQRGTSNSDSTPLISLPTSLPSLLSLPACKELQTIPSIIYNLITKPPLEDVMAQQTAFVYMDKDAVLSVLATIDYVHPVMTDLYLHTQLSLNPGATRSCEEISVSDFIDRFTNPSLDLILTNKLEGYWWSIECSLPNGVIIIHSLARSMYSHVYIFKFSPVTGVFSNMVPQDISEMRAYVQGHQDGENLFPKLELATPYPLSSKQRLRTQLGGGSSLASRSMSNLANLLPASVTKKISRTSLPSQIHDFGTALSDSVLNGLKNTVLPSLITWSNSTPTQPSAVESIESKPPSPVKQADENAFPRSRRPHFLPRRSSYLKHPLQKLRHSHDSSSSIASLTPSPTREATPTITTPAIVLTTPEHETRILKLRDTVPRTYPLSRTRSLLQSMTNLSLTSSKRFDTPTFIFWKDVYEHLCFRTDIQPDVERINLELDTNMNQQLASELSRFLAIITEMYAKEADGVQLDFIKMKVPMATKRSGNVEIRKLYGVRELLEARKRDSFSTAPESTVDKIQNPQYDEEFLSSGSQSRNSLALTDDEPTEEEIKLQGQHLANRLKHDQKMKLGLKVSEVEFSSIIMSQDAYIIEAVLAGWFLNASQWIKQNDLGWKDAVFDRQARK
ncbi:hypothetical protein H072_102 [Dactylellina haptotyla CBS 200.50]|uniref:Uncharacterized protein n=1 Tax=Dactylellina haptotyla (strain CBS 200.50) TaxID=1284197 RepID=S8C2K9_DACHA|nr:hypothetical protein H072_102 [Dactylellina haptotyla CBS 200.50]